MGLGNTVYMVYIPHLLRITMMILLVKMVSRVPSSDRNPSSVTVPLVERTEVPYHNLV